MAEENGESSSFQISSSSGGMAMPALDNGSRTFPIQVNPLDLVVGV